MSWVGVLTCREVVRLCGEDDMSQWAPGLIRAGLGRIFGVNALKLCSSDTTEHTHIYIQSGWANTYTHLDRQAHRLLLLTTCCCRRIWWCCSGCYASGCPLSDWRVSPSAPVHRSPSAPGRTSDDCARWDGGRQVKQERMENKGIHKIKQFIMGQSESRIAPYSWPPSHHLLDWARSKHSTLVGFFLILWNIDV